MTKTAPPTNYTRLTALTLCGLLVWRVGAVLVSPLDLGPDEAQYWRWGQTFDWGYYSKPPLIAWLIGSVTNVFGDTASAVRLPAPFLHTLIGALVFMLGRAMADARAGFYAVLIYILMPGVTFSSGLMTTDSVLFVFWAAGLNLLWRMRAGNAGWPITVLLGFVIGAGFLAKYAMVYFVIGVALAIAIDRPSRAAFAPRNTACVALAALIVLSPHIAWNMANDLQTLSHTADNSNWSGDLFHPENAIKFLVDQMGIFGPVSFLTLLAAIALSLRRTDGQDRDKTLWLLCFLVPALIVIMTQAVISRAHANWAATAYIAASVLVGQWMASERGLSKRIWAGAAITLFVAAGFVPDLAVSARLGLGLFLASVVITCGALSNWRMRGALWGGVGLHLAAALVFTALAAGPLHWADTLSMSNAFKRTRGWSETAQRLSEIATEHAARSIMIDERENWHGLDFYGTSTGTLTVPVLSWQRYSAPKSYAELHPVALGAPGPVLIASVRRRFRPRFREDFERIEEIGYLTIALGGGTERRFKLYLGYGYEPVPRTPEWEARFKGIVED